MLYPYTIYGFGGGFIMYLIQVIYKGYRGEEEEKKMLKGNHTIAYIEKRMINLLQDKYPIGNNLSSFIYSSL